MTLQLPRILFILFFTILCAEVFSQNITVSGKILADDTQEALVGARIAVKGGNTGTLSDEQGAFRLEVATDAVLSISFFGYQTQEIPVNGQSSLEIKMLSSSFGVDEVVVIGYGTSKKRDLTGSISSIKEADIKAVPIVSADQALQGRAAGVFVQQNSGEPGAGTTIRIRGTSSISASNEPLYVIDGIPILTQSGDLTTGAAKGPQLNPLSTINPNDIASIEVLKDASAAAIYGARAANGVVLITTKRGVAGQATIDFSMYQGWQQVRSQYELLNGSQFAHFVNEASFYAGNGRVYDDPNVFGEGTDWQDEIFQIAPISNYELSFTGGSEKVQYAVSGAFFDQDGIIVGSEFNRYNFRANVDAEVNKRIKISNSLMVSHTRSEKVQTDDNAAFDGGTITSVFGFSPQVPTRDANGNYTTKNYLVDNNGQLIDGSQVDAQGQSIQERTLNTLTNPLLKIAASPSESKISRLINNLTTTVNIREGLDLKISLGVDFTTSRDDQFTPRASRSGGESFATSGSSSSLTLLSETTLNVNQEFGKHRISAVGGFSAQNTRISSLSVQAIEIENDQFGFNNYAASRGASLSSNFPDFAFLSGLARVNYGYNDRYLITLTGRADGSSKFGDQSKWGFFPSASFAWRLTEEEFVKNLNLFESLKLRMSYGVIGNESIGPYLSQALLIPVDLVFNDQLTIGFQPFLFPNSDLRWESTEQTNIGLDATFGQGRLAITADYYKKSTFDLLLTTDVPLYTGFTDVFGNVGDLENEGVEFAFTSYNFVKKFKWNTTFNISFNRNIVTNLAGRDNIPNSGAGLFGIESWALLKEGEAVGKFYGLLTDGIFQIGEDNETTPRFAAQPPLQPGDRKFKDLNADGIISDEDRTFIGNAQSDFNFGLNNTFSYNGFELNVFVQGVSGNDLVNFNKFLLERENATSNVSLEFFANRWTPENPSNEYPRVNGDPALNRSFISDAEVEDGSYLRLKTVSLAYRFSPALLNKLNMSNVRVYITGTNLYTLTNYSGYDPEVSHFGQSATNLGADLGGFPSTKSVLVGVNLGF